MDVKDIKSLIKLVTETDITEFELENAEEKIRIKRGSSPEITYYQTPPAMMQYPTSNQPQPSAPLTETAPVAQTPASVVTEIRAEHNFSHSRNHLSFTRSGCPALCRGRPDR